MQFGTVEDETRKSFEVIFGEMYEDSKGSAEVLSIFWLSVTHSLLIPKAFKLY
jgi:hypothetical protein